MVVCSWVGAKHIHCPGASLLKDGVPNLLKYAANLSPLQRLPEEFMPTMAEVEMDGIAYLGLNFRLHPGVNGVIWAVQESTDLENWTATLTQYAPPMDHPDGTRSWFMRSQAPLHNGSVFLRLSLELTE